MSQVIVGVLGSAPGISQPPNNLFIKKKKHYLIYESYRNEGVAVVKHAEEEQDGNVERVV